MFENEVNELFASPLCKSRASRKRFSYRHIASSLCLNVASSSPVAANFYGAIAEFFPIATDFCTAFISPSAGNYGPTLI